MPCQAERRSANRPKTDCLSFAPLHFAQSAAEIPALAPKTTVSLSALPPNLLAPWSPSGNLSRREQSRNRGRPPAVDSHSTHGMVGCRSDAKRALERPEAISKYMPQRG